MPAIDKLGKIALNRITRKEFDDFGKSWKSILPDHSKAAHIVRGRQGYLNEVDENYSKGDLAELYAQYKSYLKNDMVDDDDFMDMLGDVGITQDQYKTHMDPSKVDLDRPLYISREEPNVPIDDNAVVSARVIDPNNPDTYINNAMHSNSRDIKNEVLRLEPGQSVYHPMGFADNHEAVVLQKHINDARKSGLAMDKMKYMDLAKQGKAPFAVGAAPMVGYEEGSNPMPRPTTLNTIGPAPRNPLLGGIADSMNWASDQFAKVPENMGLLPKIAAGLGINDSLRSAADYMDDASYGMNLTEGSGQTRRLDNRAIDLMDIIGMAASPMALSRRTMTKTLDDVANPGPLYYHGGEGAGKDLKVPAFVTSDRSGAEWYDGERGEGLASYYSNIKNPFELNSRQATRDFIDLANEAGIHTKVDGDILKGSWGFQSDDIRKHSPYDGDNLADLVYIPEFRDMLMRKGYDGVKLNDVLANTEIPTLISIKPNQLTLKDIINPQRDPFTGQTFDELDQAYKDIHGNKLPEMLRRQSD